MTSFIKTFTRYALDAHNAYSGTGMMMALYFMALLIVFCFCSDKKIKKSVLLPSLFLMALLYIGIPYYNTTHSYLTVFDGRLFWVLMTPVITAIGLTVFICKIEDKKTRLIALAILVPIFLYCGEFKLSNAMFEKPENSYRLRQCSIDITEHMLNETESPKLLAPYTMSYDFRQISTDVSLLFGENATSGRILGVKDDDIKEICDQMEYVTPDLNFIIPIARKNGVDYILFDTIYTELCENGNINIYGYPVNENYVGDRTPTVSFDELKDIKVVDDEKGIYWDLSAYGLKYDGTFGQYILYKFE